MPVPDYKVNREGERQLEVHGSGGALDICSLCPLLGSSSTLVLGAAPEAGAPFPASLPMLSHSPWPLQTPPQLGWEALSLEVCLPFQIQSLMSVGPATGGLRGGSQHVPPSLPERPSPGPIRASP